MTGQSIEISTNAVTVRIELSLVKRIISALEDAQRNAETLLSMADKCDREGQRIHDMYEKDIIKARNLIDALEKRGVSNDN